MAHILLNESFMHMRQQGPRVIGNMAITGEPPTTNFIPRMAELRVIDPSTIEISNSEPCYLFFRDIDTDDGVLKVTFKTNSVLEVGTYNRGE